MSEGPRRVLLVANPVSGQGRGARWLAGARQFLRAHGAEVREVVTRGRGDAERAGHEAPGEVDEVWAIGGDGTLNELAQGLAGSEVVLVPLPTGTGNVVAREVGIARRMSRALNAAWHGNHRRVDLGRADGRDFLFMLSAGLDGTVVRHVSERRGGKMSLWKYAPAMWACRQSEEPRFQVEADGEPLGGVCWAAIFNVQRYAGPFRVCREARIDSGDLQLLTLRDPICPRFGRVLRAAVQGRIQELPDGDSRPVRRLVLEGALCMQMDGDPYPGGDGGRCEVESKAASLSIRVP